MAGRCASGTHRRDGDESRARSCGWRKGGGGGGGGEGGCRETEDAAERKQRDGAEKDRTPSLVNNAN